MAGSWEIWSVALKWAVLVATAGAIGGSYVLALARKRGTAEQAQQLRRHLRNYGLLGFNATVLWFLLQIGAVNRSGIGGMFDVALGKILLQSGLGDALSLRLTAFLALTLFALRPHPLKTAPATEAAVHTVIALILCSAIGTTGHVSTLAGFPRAVLSFHVLAVFLWIGALHPLMQLCREQDPPKLSQLQQLMRTFGTQALGIVATLLLSGIYLATQLLAAPAELLTTAYGRVLLLKIFGVYGVLMFAGMNKLLLVPRLVTSGSALALQKSIRMEWIVALLVLAVTSWLTTITGPARMQ
jgi:putative copper resistance protein D